MLRGVITDKANSKVDETSNYIITRDMLGHDFIGHQIMIHGYYRYPNHASAGRLVYIEPMSTYL